MGKLKAHYTREAHKKLEKLAKMLKQKLITEKYVREQLEDDEIVQMFGFCCDKEEMDMHIEEFIDYVKTSVKLVVDNTKVGKNEKRR